MLTRPKPKKPLYSDSFYYKGYWSRIEMFGRGWKVWTVKGNETSFYMEILPENCHSLDIRRFVKEWILLFLSAADKSEVA